MGSVCVGLLRLMRCLMIWDARHDPFESRINEHGLSELDLSADKSRSQGRLCITDSDSQTQTVLYRSFHFLRTHTFDTDLVEGKEVSSPQASVTAYMQRMDFSSTRMLAFTKICRLQCYRRH